MTCSLRIKYKNTSETHLNAPTEDKSDEKKKCFYAQLGDYDGLWSSIMWTWKNKCHCTETV